MRRWFLGLVAGLALVPAAHARQDLDRAVLDKLKSASAFIVVESAFGRGSGSGFLFLKKGSTGYLITCDHVIRGAETAKVIFGSGTAGERVFTGKVIAGDEDRDLACVILRDAKDLPAPLELGQKTAVTETESVYVAGFPFGRMLAAGEKNPEISITKVSVSSVRRDTDNRVTAVQMSGDVNPGNSGGPVIDAKGRVIGVTQSKVRGSSTAFAVPSEEILGFLKGRVRSSSFTPVYSGVSSVKYEVAIGLIDPLGTLKSVGVSWCPKKALGAAEPKPEKDGAWGRAHSSMKSVSLKIDEDTATGVFEVPRGGASEPQEQTLLVQVSYVTSDGKMHWTEPGPLEVTFADSGVPAAKIDPKDNPSTAPPGAAPKGVDIPVGDDLKVLASLRLHAAIGSLLLSPDGGALYALDLSEGKAYRLNPDTLEIVAQGDVMDNAVAMCLTPDGKTLYVGGRDPNPQKTNGYIQTIPTSGMKSTGTFSVAFAIHNLVATNGGTIVATGTGQWGGLAVLDASKKSLLGTCHSIYGGATIRLHPDQARVYTGDMGLSPADYRCVAFTKKNAQNQYDSYDSRYHGEHPLGGHFEITPDGRYLLGGWGSVLRLGKTKDADLAFVGKIDPGVAIGVAKNSNTFIVATAEGFLKIYDLQSLELKKSVKVGRMCSRVALDASKSRLYAVAGPAAQDGRSVDRWAVTAGDIISISLTGK